MQRIDQPTRRNEDSGRRLWFSETPAGWETRCGRSIPARGTTPLR
jgi:hypothetical protein